VEYKAENLMFSFALEVIVVSILVSLFATWIELIPRYPKRSHNLLQQALNTGILTFVLTWLFLFHIVLSWALLFLVILLVLWSSVRITNRIAQRRVGATGTSQEKNADESTGDPR